MSRRAAVLAALLLGALLVPGPPAAARGVSYWAVSLGPGATRDARGMPMCREIRKPFRAIVAELERGRTGFLVQDGGDSWQFASDSDQPSEVLFPTLEHCLVTTGQELPTARRAWLVAFQGCFNSEKGRGPDAASSVCRTHADRMAPRARRRDGWLRIEESKFVAAMPGAVRYHEDRDSRSGAVQVVSMWTSHHSGRRYALSSVELPAPEAVDRSGLLSSQREGLLSRNDGVLVRETRVTVADPASPSGWPGVEVEATLKRVHSRAVVRWWLAGVRLYQLTYIGPEDESGSEAAAEFAKLSGSFAHKR